LAAASPLLAFVFVVPALNLGGIPPFSGFVGKVALLEAGAANGSVLAWMLVGGSVVTSLLTLYVVSRVWTLAFWRTRTDAPEGDVASAAPSVLLDNTEEAYRDADALAREALAEDAQLWLAHMVLATTAVGRQHWDEAVARADDAVRLAPEHPTALASAALICLRANEWTRASAWADEALRLNPSLPAYLHVLLALDRLLRGDDAGALAEASLVDVPGMPWGPLYRGLALSGLGRIDDAARELQAAAQVTPEIRDPRTYFVTFLRLDDDQLAGLLRRFKPLTDAGAAGRPPAPGSHQRSDAGL
jgi:tetratricopeptide (TPR) repeat protein